MNSINQVSNAPSARDGTPDIAPRDAAYLPTWRLNVMRIGYAFMGVGLALTKWPELVSHEPWELKQGVVVTILVAMSVLALLGLRYPQRMLPILLFEAGWKVIWLGVVALPPLLRGELTGATLDEAIIILWVVLILAVIPWGHVVRQYVLARGDQWR